MYDKATIAHPTIAVMWPVSKGRMAEVVVHERAV